MKKLVLAMVMFLCGSSFFALAQDPVKKTQPATEQTDSTTTAEPVNKEDTTTVEPVKEESAPATEVPESSETPAQSAE
ncbi:hypothetical protein [uncultured Bacteroides sp.]|uniref:hypothetical protein n=1 Tax=uncultured Bacteroides sp. TaxID=162156 RepID=UPI002AA5FADE|nr:hypothetical protein [uncultured Bacteroides sp.]